ncbi:MAG: M20 metallopeptidase family protein [Acetivibrio ethanolgignens]
MKELLQEAKAIEEEVIANRRYLHENPECGFELENTCRFVTEKLKEYGYEPKQICKSGIVATIGDETKGKTILLRADMDALPMTEETDLPFRSKKEAAHTCGHDTHTAMLLGAAKLLKAHEKELNGCVKLMFQPDEEGTSPDGVSGADRMLEAGVLENPKVDAVFSLHIMSGENKKGTITYRRGTLMSSCDNFVIKIQGKGAHGSQPHESISPINIAAHIYFGLQELISRELPGYEQGTITAGTFNSGFAPNIIPDTAEITGTIRMTDERTRARIKERMTELCTSTARAYGGSCEVEFMHGIPSVYNNPELTEELISYSEELLGYKCKEEKYVNSGSDDSSVISQNAPTCYVMLACGDAEEGYIYSHHNPHILFNEEVFYLGTALYANSAIEWLKNR